MCERERERDTDEREREREMVEEAIDRGKRERGNE